MSDVIERLEKLINILKNIKTETCCAGDLHSSHVEITSKDKFFLELQEFIQSEITKAREEEKEKCKYIFVDRIDWAEWGMDDADAEVKFEEEYKKLK